MHDMGVTRQTCEWKQIWGYMVKLVTLKIEEINDMTLPKHA